jgi:hypothetical protein
MPLILGNTAPVHLVLSKDRIKSLKSGHPWVYAESVAVKPPAPSGSLALIKTKDGDIIAKVGTASLIYSLELDPVSVSVEYILGRGHHQACSSDSTRHSLHCHAPTGAAPHGRS